MNIGDKIVWRFNDKKTWKRGEITSIFGHVIEITQIPVEPLGATVSTLVKQDEIEWEKYE